MVGPSLYGLSGVAAAIGQPEAGGRLLGAAESMRLILGRRCIPQDQLVRARALTALTKALGEERLAASHEAGTGPDP